MHCSSRASAGSTQHKLDAIVSTDGDADRPLVIDGTGEFLRGDVLGMIAARFLGADRVVTPVTSNSAIEGVGWFGRVDRTKVGSPFVIEGMEDGGAGLARRRGRVRGQWRHCCWAAMWW